MRPSYGIHVFRLLCTGLIFQIQKLRPCVHDHNLPSGCVAIIIQQNQEIPKGSIPNFFNSDFFLNFFKKRHFLLLILRLSAVLYMLVFLTLRFFILIKLCVTGTDFPLWYYMPFTVAGDPCSNLIRRGGIIFSTTQAKKHHTKYKVQNFCMCGCKRQTHTLSLRLQDFTDLPVIVCAHLWLLSLLLTRSRVSLSCMLMEKTLQVL